MGCDLSYGRAEKSTAGVDNYLNSAYDPNSYIVGVEQEKWINLQTVLWYDADEQGYYSTKFVDGKPIKNADGDVAVEKFYPTATDLKAIQGRNSLCFSISAGVGTENSSFGEKRILIDNVCIRLHDGLTVDQYMQVPSDSGSISIPIYNAYKLEGDGVPEYVKKAVIENNGFSQENIVIEKFSQEDKLLLNGTLLEGYTGTLSNSIIKLSNVKERQTGENLRITLKDIKSVDGGGLLNSTMLVATDKNFKGVIKSCFTDINGNELSVASASSVPTEVSKLKLMLKGVSEAVITDGTVSYTATGGEFDFTTNPLKPNTTYTVKLDGSDYTTFKTAGNGSLSFSNIKLEAGNASVKYVNTLDEDKTVYFTVMYFDTAHKLIKAVTEAKNAAKNYADTMTQPVDSSLGAAYCKVVLLDGLQAVKPLTSMFVNPEQGAEQASTAATKEIEISPFDNAKTAVVKGALTEKAKQRITVVLLAEGGSLVFANDLYSANDGSYTFEINMPDSAQTGTYKLYAAAAGRALANGTEVHYSKDSGSALESVNGASTAKSMAQVIKDNQADLEFYYDEYYNSFDDDDKLAVAALILNAKNELKTVNGIGFVTTDKQTAVKTFRKAVIVRAVTLGKVTDYSEIVPHFDELSAGAVYEWLDNSGSKEISSELRSKWRAGILNRLKGANFISFADFLTKLRAALMFECIADSDGYGNIKNILTDYVSQAYISGLSSTYITNAVCSELVKKVYTGFEYTQLIADIKAYYDTPPAGGGNSVTGNGGNTGGVFPSGVNAPTPIDGTESAVNGGDEAKYDTFRDIGDCWAKDIILELANKNIISGIGDDCFAPERSITREELAAIIVRMLDLSAVFEAELPFADVTEDDWCYEAVKIAYQHGIINGKSASEFGEGESISRQDMAVMLKNVLDVSKIEYAEGTISFADMTEIEEYARKAVNILAEMRIINGYEDNTFRPKDLATRAEASKVIYEMLKVLSRKGAETK